MTVSISGSSSPQSTVPAYSPSEASPAEAAPKTASPKGDSVKLSQAAQIHLMKQQGQGLSQIAANLGLSVSAVDGYLGVAVARTAVAANAPTRSPSTPAKG